VTSPSQNLESRESTSAHSQGASEGDRESELSPEILKAEGHDLNAARGIVVALVMGGVAQVGLILAVRSIWSSFLN